MINSLALGFRILGLRLDLLIIPVLLSLAALYWPPADISLLFADLQAIFAEAQDAAQAQADAGALPAETPTPFAPEALLQGLDTSILPLGQLLVNRTFLRVPGLVVALPLDQLLTDWSPKLSSIPDFLLVLAAFSAAGVAMGTLYQWQLASTVDTALRAWTERDPPDAADADPEVAEASPWDAFWFRVWQTGLYLVLLVVLVTALSLVVSLLMAALALVMPGAVFPLMGLYMLFLLMALPIFLFLQTYIIPGIVLDSLKVVAAARQSVALIRNNVVSTLAFLLLSGFILFGIEQALGSINAGFNPVLLLLSSISFAYVGTGTAMAFLVFYRSRCLMSDGVDITAWFKSMESGDG